MATNAWPSLPLWHLLGILELVSERRGFVLFKQEIFEHQSTKIPGKKPGFCLAKWSFRVAAHL